MKRIITTLVSAAALLATPVMAGTPTFTPSGATVNLTGTLDVEQTVALSCGADFTIQFSGTSAAQLTGADLSGGFLWLCNSVGFPNLPRPVEVVEPTTSGPATLLKIVGLTVKTIAGSCTGDVYVEWDNGSKTATFNNASFGSPACTIDGVLDGDNPAASIDVL